MGKVSKAVKYHLSNDHGWPSEPEESAISRHEWLHDQDGKLTRHPRNRTRDGRTFVALARGLGLVK